MGLASKLDDVAVTQGPQLGQEGGLPGGGNLPGRGSGLCGQAAARGPLRELGTDPESGRPVVIKDGRFGPYFTDGVTNVTLRRGDDPATVTPERAYELLAEKRAKGPVKKRTSALEMEQNAGRTRWDFATADAKLTAIMADIHDSCVAAAEEYGRPGDYVLGANAAGFTRVADVMIAHGIV